MGTGEKNKVDTLCKGRKGGVRARVDHKMGRAVKCPKTRVGRQKVALEEQ